jgi:hypothetical protein
MPIPHQSFARMYYWAGYFGARQLVEKFIQCIGLSPFIKLYQ